MSEDKSKERKSVLTSALYMKARHQKPLVTLWNLEGRLLKMDTHPWQFYNDYYIGVLA